MVVHAIASCQLLYPRFHPPCHVGKTSYQEKTHSGSEDKLWSHKINWVPILCYSPARRKWVCQSTSLSFKFLICQMALVYLSQYSISFKLPKPLSNWQGRTSEWLVSNTKLSDPLTLSPFPYVVSTCFYAGFTLRPAPSMLPLNTAKLMLSNFTAEKQLVVQLSALKLKTTTTGITDSLGTRPRRWEPSFKPLG